jgi:NAD(P)-dependent dehydrogenase (short-subunit alcohol dehydrogenase family)
MKSVHDLMNLSGRTALITGGAGKIGAAISTSLAELGCNIVLLDRPGVSFDDVIDALLKVNDTAAEVVTCDLENEDDRAEAVNFIKEKYTSLNILVNNAAFVGTSNLQGWVSAFDDQDIGVWRRALEVNLTAAFDLSKRCRPLMSDAAGASIVNIGSIYGMCGPDLALYEGTEMGNPAAYAVSKGGLIQMTRWLSTVLAPNIRVNCISPGGVWRNQPEKFVHRYIERTPLKRMAVEEDFKGVVAYLASDLSQYCTGQNIAIDGGWTAW